MIDSLYARYTRLRDEPVDPNYQPRDSIRGRSLVNEGADKLAVIFPGWHTHKFPVNRLSNRLAKRGWAVLTYDFHDQIIGPSDEMVAESFKYIRGQIGKELEGLNKKHHYKQIHFIGISLGNVSMALVADKFPDFNSATVVVGGEDLAVDMWHGLRTLFIRDEFKKAHVGLKRLDMDWSEEAPMNHAKRFTDKKVKFILSRSDKFILPKYQKKLLENIESAGADISVKTRWSGHLMIIVRYCLFDSPI
jgi:hypothetical protein